jgi:hypothetical protein
VDELSWRPRRDSEGLEPPTPSLGLKKNRLKKSDLHLPTSLDVSGFRWLLRDLLRDQYTSCATSDKSLNQNSSIPDIRSLKHGRDVN